MRKAEAVLAVPVFLSLLFPLSSSAARAIPPCGSTSLEGTVRVMDGELRCGPGEPLAVREDLAPARPGRRPIPLVSFPLMTDVHVIDEE